MATVLQQLQSKVDTLGIGVISHLSTSPLVESMRPVFGDNTQVTQVILKEPKIYKSIFCLDNLGIDKSLKSVVIEVKDSVLRLYYLLDSSCFFIDFECNYQTLELIKELPIELIHYLRILCSKKGILELVIREDTLLIMFEDTFPSKMPMKERKERKVDKYVLYIPLSEVNELDKQVVEFSYSLIHDSDCKTTPIGKNIPNLSINLSTIICPYHKEPIDYWGFIITNIHGDFTVVDTSGIKSTLVICPTLISKNFEISNISEEIAVVEDNELLTLDEEVNNTIEEINE